jgi:3-methyladenine DNA glycosylase Mpg
VAAIKELEAFIGEYDPQVAAQARAALRTLRRRLPGAFELVYNYSHALVIAFGASDKGHEAVFSIALYPKWITLYFLQGAKLLDPKELLEGSGKQVRGIRLASAKDLDSRDIKWLMNAALANQPIPKSAGGCLIIKSNSAAKAPQTTPAKPARRRPALSSNG